MKVIINMYTKGKFLNVTKNDVFYLLLGFCLGYCVMFWTSLFRYTNQFGKCPNDKISTVYNFDKMDDAFLLVAVMTTRAYLKTRAADIHDTWGRHVPGNILYFVGGSEPYEGDLPVVTLHDIDDTGYPPQIKSFAMIKYISTHLLYDYEWFMRSDDDVFVKTGLIERFLRSVNSSKILYIGQSGYGTVKEKGQLGISRYCMGGPGVFFTRSILKILSSHMKACLQNTVTSHEDTELGRCVLAFTGVLCTNAYDLRTTFVNDIYNRFEWYNKTLGDAADRALTLHPLKHHPHQYRLESHFAHVNIKKLKSKISMLTRDIVNVERFVKTVAIRKRNSSAKYTSQPEPITRMESKTLTSHHKSVTSQHKSVTIQNKAVSSTTPITKTTVHTSEALSKIIDKGSDDEWSITMLNRIHSLHNLYATPDTHISMSEKSLSQLIARTALKHLSHYRYPFLNICYDRYKGGRVAEHISIKKTGTKRLIIERTIQHFTGIQFYDLVPRKEPHIYVLLPLYKRSNIFEKFLTNMNNIVNEYKGVVTLKIMLYNDTNQEYLRSKNIINLTKLTANNLIINLAFVNDSFSRGHALSVGSVGLANDSLLVFMDVDMIIDVHFLNHVVLNTKYRKQVYFPICFSQYDPRIVCFGNTSCDYPVGNYDNRFGRWRSFGFGISAMYKGDLMDVGGFNLKIKGWGSEDEDLFDKLVRSKLQIFRGIDPSLIHIYHIRKCSVNLSKIQYHACVSSRYELSGDIESLVKAAQGLNMGLD